MSYQQTSSSFYQNSFEGVTDGYGIDFNGNLGENLQENYTNYESGYGIGGRETFLSGNDSLTGTSFGSDSGDNYSLNNFEQQSSSIPTANSSNLYQDPNPQIIRRPAPASNQTYVQRVYVRFLKPPSLPPPEPLIIKEVRPPQPPPPPPLYIRQRPPPPPKLAPLIIREAPPKLPPPVGPQVINKVLPAEPAPPRSVIIERLPPLPPKPRDIIVERWLPYQKQQKRRVIIQRAPPPVVQKPRNIIIYYEPPKAQVVRRFQNLGVQPANPDEYLARFGPQLEDPQTLVSHARQVGVVEDLSPPVNTTSDFQPFQSLTKNFDEISTNNYDSSSLYQTDFESSTLGFVNNNSSNRSTGTTSYELYSSSPQIYT